VGYRRRVQFVAALLLLGVSWAVWWYIPHAWRQFRRDGHLRVSGRGLTVDFKRAWAVRCYLAWDALLGLALLAGAVAVVVAGLR